MVEVRGAQCRDALRTGFAPETTSTKRNKRDQGKRKHSEINKANRFTAAHNGLVAGSGPAGPTNEPVAYQAYLRSPHQKRPLRLRLPYLSISQTNAASRARLGPPLFNHRFGGLIARNGWIVSYSFSATGRLCLGRVRFAP